MNEIILKIREKECKIFYIQNKCEMAFYYLDEIKRCIINDPYYPPSNIDPNDIISWFNDLTLEEKKILGLNEMEFIFSNVFFLDKEK